MTIWPGSRRSRSSNRRASARRFPMWPRGWPQTSTCTFPWRAPTAPLGTPAPRTTATSWTTADCRTKPNNHAETPMPLRDHFRPPASKRHSWEGFHGMCPGEIIRQLREQLPEGFIAEPRVHLGALYEGNVATYESGDAPATGARGEIKSGGTAARAAVAPVVALEAEEEEEYEYELRVYDAERERTLVAAIELVSPANKDRPRARNAFVAKCAELVRRGEHRRSGHGQELQPVRGTNGVRGATRTRCARTRRRFAPRRCGAGRAARRCHLKRGRTRSRWARRCRSSRCGSHRT